MELLTKERKQRIKRHTVEVKKKLSFRCVSGETAK